MSNWNYEQLHLSTPNDRLVYLEKQLGEKTSMLELFPHYINIETINTCNARCIMCGIDFDKRSLVRMTDQLFSKIIEELSQWSSVIRKVNLYFDNEPLLDRDLARKVKLLKQIGIKVVNIASNGSSLTPNRSRELLEAGLDEIYISIDSMIPASYEKIRVGLSFKKVYENTVNFIKIRNELGAATRVRLQMIVQDENDTEQADFIEHWKQHLTAGDCVAAMRAHNWGGVVSVKKLERDRFINSLPCTSLWSNAMIHADGKMAMCSVDTEQTSNYAVGDVNLNSIAEIWNGESIKAMRLKHIESKREQHKLCNGCTTYRPNTKEYFLPL